VARVPTAHIVISEGPSDQNFLEELRAVRSLGHLEIVPRDSTEGGNTTYVTRLKALKVRRGISKHPGIILMADNDNDPKELFKNIRSQIGLVPGFGVPNEPRTAVAGDPALPPITILMIPWDNVAGNLETLCYKAASEQRPKEAEAIEQFVKRLGFDNHPDWHIGNLSKLRMQIMLTLACPGDPFTSFRYTWSKEKRRPADIVPLENPCFNQICDWFQSLRQN